MRIALVVLLALAVAGCATGGGTSGRTKSLTILPPPNAFRAGASPYTIPWPKDANGKLLAGVTIVEVLLDAQGKVLDVNIRQSSGHQELDDAAVEGMRRYHYQPLVADGHPIQAYARFPIMMSPTGALLPYAHSNEF